MIVITLASLTMQTTRSIFLGVAAAALLAGCGSAASSSSGGAPAGTQSGPAAASAPASQASGGTTSLTCSLAPPTLVGSTLGVAGLTAPREADSDGGAACVYTGSNIVSLNLASGATAAKMAAEQHSIAKTQQVKAYPGVGDEAFTGTLAAGGALPPSNTLVARKGSVEIMIVSTASITAEKSLAAQLFAKIG